MKKQRRTGKLSVKLCALFLIVVLPFILFSAIMFAGNYRSLRQKTVESVDYSCRMIADNIDETLQNVFLAENALNVDDLILYMIGNTRKNSVSNYQQYLNMSDVQKHLRTMQLSHASIHEISLHIPALNKSIYSAGKITALDERYREFQNEMDTFVCVDAHKNYLSMICGYPWINRDGYIYYLVSEIDCKKLKENILDMFTGEYGNTYVYLEDEEHQKHLIINNGDASLFDAWCEASRHTRNAQMIRLGTSRYLECDAETSLFNIGILSLTSTESIFHDINRQTFLLLMITALTVGLILFFIWIILRMINDPLNRLTKAFASVQEGGLDTEIKIDRKDEFGEIYEKFNSMTNRMRVLIDDNYRSKLLIQDSRLRQLQAQVNPHFLYNSLRFIYAMSQMQDYDGIQEFTTKLASFYHYASENTEETVTLSKENEYACAYLGIQQMRFEDSIVVQIDALPKILEAEPALHFSVQTIVENAFKYAMPTRPQDGRILLRYRRTDDGYVVIVEDNGNAITDDDIEYLNGMVVSQQSPEKGTGLYNLARRLNFRWGAKAYLRFDRSSLGGLCVEMHVHWKGGN